MGDGSSSSFNHPTTGTAGGASFEPTPANNVGGGSGWGDPGFVKGGAGDTAGTASRHVPAPKPASTAGNFLGLEDQKARDESKYLQRADLTAHGKPTTTTGGEPTCGTEDHGFMEHKPAGPDTLPGWKTAKNLFGA